MTDALVCWKCRTSISELPFPLERLAECPACHADLHVCRMCDFYEPRASRSCRELIAEEVTDKEHSNFCDYFRARPGAHDPHDDAGIRAARAKLNALFGADSREVEVGALRKAPPRSEAASAREHLEQLFGSGRKREKE